MVQTHQPPLRVYKYPFELVVLAYEMRFPKCDILPMFVGSDVLSQESSEDGATSTVVRRCGVDLSVPRFLKSLAGMDHIHFVHRLTLNRRERTMHIRSHNETFSNRLTVVENCCYSVHPDNEDWTCFEQVGSLDIRSFFGFESMVEKIAMKHYANSIVSGNEILEVHRKELADEGITHVPRWTPSSPPRALLSRVPPTRPPPLRRPPARPPPFRPPPITDYPYHRPLPPTPTTDPPVPELTPNVAATLPTLPAGAAAEDAASEELDAKRADGATENTGSGWLVLDWLNPVCWLRRSLGWLYSGVGWLQWWRVT